MNILFICATDLSNYEAEILIIFTECIEGRIEVLFEPAFLVGLSNHFKLNSRSLTNFARLKNMLICLYASRWSKKMNDKELYWNKVNIISNEIIGQLNLEYVEPLYFMKNHLNIDWM